MNLRSGLVVNMEKSYVRLSKFNGDDDVDEWLGNVDECIRLLGIKGDEAASYVLYHITGESRLELSMLGVKLTTIEGIKEFTRTLFEN